MDVYKELAELRITSREKAINKARLAKWRIRYFKACGRYPDGDINQHLYCVAEFGVNKAGELWNKNVDKLLGVKRGSRN